MVEQEVYDFDYQFACPNCGNLNGVDDDCLPGNIWESADFQCPSCLAELKIGRKPQIDAWQEN